MDQNSVVHVKGQGFQIFTKGVAFCRSCLWCTSCDGCLWHEYEHGHEHELGASGMSLCSYMLNDGYGMYLSNFLFKTCSFFESCGQHILSALFLLPVFQPMDSMQMPAQRAPGNYGDENGSRKRRGGKSNMLFNCLTQFGDSNYHPRSC